MSYPRAEILQFRKVITTKGRAMLYTDDNDKEMAKQAKMCLNFNGNPERIARARGWRGAVKGTFLAMVEEMKADSLETFKTSFNARRGR